MLAEKHLIRQNNTIQMNQYRSTFMQRSKHETTYATLYLELVNSKDFDELILKTFIAIDWCQAPIGCCHHMDILVHLGFSSGTVGGKLNTKTFPQQSPFHAHLEHLHSFLPAIMDIQHGFPTVFRMGEHLGRLHDLPPGKTMGQKHLADFIHLCVDWLLGIHDLIDLGYNCRWQNSCLQWLGHGNHRFQQSAQMKKKKHAVTISLCMSLQNMCGWHWPCL